MCFNSCLSQFFVVVFFPPECFREQKRALSYRRLTPAAPDALTDRGPGTGGGSLTPHVVPVRDPHTCSIPTTSDPQSCRHSSGILICHRLQVARRHSDKRPPTPSWATRRWNVRQRSHMTGEIKSIKFILEQSTRCSRNVRVRGGQRRISTIWWFNDDGHVMTVLFFLFIYFLHLSLINKVNFYDIIFFPLIFKISSLRYN